MDRQYTNCALRKCSRYPRRTALRMHIATLKDSEAVLEHYKFHCILGLIFTSRYGSRHRQAIKSSHLILENICVDNLHETYGTFRRICLTAAIVTIHSNYQTSLEGVKVNSRIMQNLMYLQMNSLICTILTVVR